MKLTAFLARAFIFLGDDFFYNRPCVVDFVLVLSRFLPRNSKIPLRSIVLQSLGSINWLVDNIDIFVCQKILYSCSVTTFEYSQIDCVDLNKLCLVHPDISPLLGIIAVSLVAKFGTFMLMTAQTCHLDSSHEQCHQTLIQPQKGTIVMCVFFENPFKTIDKNEYWLSEMTERITKHDEH